MSLEIMMVAATKILLKCLKAVIRLGSARRRWAINRMSIGLLFSPQLRILFRRRRLMIVRGWVKMESLERLIVVGAVV
jgi:hypothetical protein